MKTHPLLFFAFTLAANFSFSLNSANAQNQAIVSETELVRVQPANIGPWRGKGANPLDSPGESDLENDPNAPRETSTGTLEIIFDASNSMNAKMNGVPKINLAKDAMYHLLDTLSKTTLSTGLRVFGHDQTISREDRPRACVNSEMLVPIGAGNTKKIRAQIPKMIAWGRTPIAYSLEQAGDDLDDYLEKNPMILLISDGVESCDGDPIKVILNSTSKCNTQVKSKANRGIPNTERFTVALCQDTPS